MMGLSPEQFWALTLREYSYYREGFTARHSMMWDHTASIMALLANVNAPKGKKFQPGDFHPYTTKSNQGVQSKEEALALLEKMKNFS
jgi:hypothetical protein